MTSYRSFFVLFSLLIFPLQIYSQTFPTHELRAVYLTTTNSLDWPKSLNREEQRSSLKQIVRDLKHAHFNAIFFQVRARGDAYYKSAFEPWAENLAGTLGKDPGWDPLQFLLDEAHAGGMEVHAWFNVYKIRGPVPPQPSSPQHPVRALSNSVVFFDNEYWFDPGRPEVNDYLIRVLSDLTGKYDIDGVCFDFIRYPLGDFPDRATYNKYGNGIPLESWRRENINKFVRDAHDAVSRQKPEIKLGAAPLGNFGGSLSAQPDSRSARGGVGDFYQDSRTWLKNGWLDYLAPQIYWPLEFETQGPDFAHITRTWLKEAEGRHIYVSIGAYKPEILNQLSDQITASRMLGAHGQVFFRYENVKEMNRFESSYTGRVQVPQMPWKKNRSQ